MRSQSFRALLLSAFMLAAPGLAFARGEGARMYTGNAYKTQKPTTCINRNLGVRAGGNVYSYRGGQSGTQPVRFTQMGGSAFRK